VREREIYIYFPLTINLSVGCDVSGLVHFRDGLFRPAEDLGGRSIGFSFLGVDLAQIVGFVWVPIGGGDKRLVDLIWEWNDWV
jgi:hypothetical protein